MKPLIGITVGRYQNPATQQRNLLGLAEAYVQAVLNQGGIPVMVPLGIPETDLLALFERLDGLVLSGGGDIDPTVYGKTIGSKIMAMDRNRDMIEIKLMQLAAGEEKPVLAICRGMQVMNVAMGGTMIQDIDSELPEADKHSYFKGYPRDHIAHSVKVEEDSRLAKILGSPIVKTNSLHHQACDVIGETLEVTAVAPDGIIEGLELPDHPFAVGVQWHPECIQEQPEMRQLFTALVEACNA